MKQRTNPPPRPDANWADDLLKGETALITRWALFLGCAPEHLSDVLDRVDEDEPLFKRFCYTTQISSDWPAVKKLLAKKDWPT